MLKSCEKVRLDVSQTSVIIVNSIRTKLGLIVSDNDE